MNATETLEVNAPKSSHLLSVVQNLLQAGWVIRAAPRDGRLARNGQVLILRAGKQDVRLRLFVYKVTGSSRGKPDERRIEITSTYQKDLKRKRGYQDVVLGIGYDRDIFVGVDARRIAHGGPTGNASSFFDREGLDWKKRDEILIIPRSAKLFPNGTEFHAFIKPSRLAEYFLNVEAIHAGSYAGHGPYSGQPRYRRAPASFTIPAELAGESQLELEGPAPTPLRLRVNYRLVKAFEEGDTKRVMRARISPEELLVIKRRCEENGHIGEEFVLNYERRRLRRAGKKGLAGKVKWVSQKSTCEGYDILSFELDGRKRLIEVKATAGKGRVFEMTDNEWRRAKQEGGKYYIYRVTEVRARPALKIFADPSALESKGLLRKSPSGWWITLL
jgi:hypothetical protein